MHQDTAVLEFLEKELVVDIESERLGGRIGIGAVDEKRNFAREFRHYILSEKSIRPGAGPG